MWARDRQGLWNSLLRLLVPMHREQGKKTVPMVIAIAFLMLFPFIAVTGRNLLCLHRGDQLTRHISCRGYALVTLCVMMMTTVLILSQSIKTSKKLPRLLVGGRGDRHNIGFCYFPGLGPISLSRLPGKEELTCKAEVRIVFISQGATDNDALMRCDNDLEHVSKTLDETKHPSYHISGEQVLFRYSYDARLEQLVECSSYLVR